MGDAEADDVAFATTVELISFRFCVNNPLGCELWHKIISTNQ